MKLKRAKRFFLCAGCFALLLITWVIAVNSKSPLKAQQELMEQAAALMKDGIYVRAVPLLEEAANYSTPYTAQVEEALKEAYLELLDTSGYKRRYTNLLDEQLRRADAHPDIFAEAANYYISISKTQGALEILRSGIAKTGSEDLIELYEMNR